jgi:hypothetical protein
MKPETWALAGLAWVLWEEDLDRAPVVLGGLEDLVFDFERRAAEADDVLDVEDAVGVLRHQDADRVVAVS